MLLSELIQQAQRSLRQEGDKPVLMFVNGEVRDFAGFYAAKDHIMLCDNKLLP